ncbi:PREDICTED: uncharacterized protein LOC107124501 [Gekko japonicus]|uniref:Uncharacterized protein LOC107124501 n=1 Tax=Gekko japonicus TaxID=146911 RepID=A0ABM1LBX9_GEKJA|nr:PREDICTED: uncharacterized protein LOC107124501 [Gekko japonicus]
MATESSLETLQRELTCSICLGFFKEPVSIDCGHNFCQACITQCWGRSDDENTSCPQCRRWSRKRSFRPNRELGNVVEVTKRLRLEAANALAGQRLCEKHQEPLKLFCEQDETPVCVICRESRAHKAHPMLPIEEAAQDYKKRIDTHVKALKYRREKLKESKEDLECRSQADQDDVQTEKQKVESEFNQIHEFLEKIERFLIIMLKKFDKEIVQRRDGAATKLSEEITRLDTLIVEVEEKCQQSASEFLQDIRNILNRCQDGQLPQLVTVPSSPTDLEKKLGHFSLKNIVIKEALEKCRETMISELAKARAMETAAKKAIVTLDPNSAHPVFVMSEDRKCVKQGTVWQQLPDTPERFDTATIVLGCERFASGIHYWEVEVGDGQNWALGVSWECVKRKGDIAISPEEGIWALGLCGDEYKAFTSPETCLTLDDPPEKIQVFLHYERGWVAFFDADYMSLIFIFQSAKFQGEKVCPFFKLYSPTTELKLCPCQWRRSPEGYRLRPRPASGSDARSDGGSCSSATMSGMSAEQLLQQRLLRSRLRSAAQHLGGGPPPQPMLPPLSPPSPPDSPPPGTTPAEIPAGPRCPSETWCSLCRVYCPEPVCLPCGHNFCTGCIGQRLGEPKINISCLECGATARKRNLRPIKPPPLLGSLGVDRAKRQRLDSTGGVGGVAAAAAPAVVPPPPVAPPVAPPAASGAAPVAVVAAAAATTTAAAAPPPPPLPLLSLAPTPPTPPTPKPPSPPPSPAPAAAKRTPAPLLLSPTSTVGAGDASGGRLCDKHREVLQFFCEEDEAPICAHCDRSQEHRAHSIFHVERAARDYREQVQTQLENLKQEKNLLWNQKLSEEKKIEEYLDKAQAERQEIISEFERLRQFLKDQEQQLLTRLEELDKEIEKRKEESIARFSEELSRLGELITEMEVKSKQPASEFLQDIKKLLSRCATGQFQLPEEASPNLEERLGDFSQKSTALKKTLDRFQDHVIAAVEKAEIAKTVNDKADVILNPDVSSALLSLDQRSMGYEGPQHKLPALQYVPDTPKRLDSRALVLGCDGFTSGRYFWELEVGDGDFWAVGVTRDPSGKKGMMNCSPEDGIWAVGLWKGQHWALTSPVTALSLCSRPKRIRVSLDYVGECVTFTDGDTEDLIFTFPPASFNGTRTHPLLWVVGFPAQTVFLRRMGVKYPTGVHEMDILSPPTFNCRKDWLIAFEGILGGVSTKACLAVLGGKLPVRRKNFETQENETYPLVSAQTAMATASPAKRLQNELSCSLCNDYFMEPVCIHCGHSFCQACITRFWGEQETDFCCPQCGEESLTRELRPNKELGVIVAAIAKQMKFEIIESAGGEKMCGVHQKPLTFFCKDEGKLMCPSYAGAEECATRILVSAEEAAEDYKEKLEGEKQKIVSKFEELQRFLKQQKEGLLDQLDELAKKQEKIATRLSSEICVYDTLIHEVEKKCKQPASVFLQDVGETLSRCKIWEFQQPLDISPELEEKLCAISKNYLIMQATMEEFKVKVTLDPDTAHSSLNVSADQKILRRGCGESELYPQRFTEASCVLGCEGFASGRHYWEVKVGEEASWAVGVARESVDRKEELKLNSKEGIWVMRKEPKFWIEPARLSAGGLTLNSVIPKTVGVFLDYRLKRVMFFDAIQGTALYTFRSCSFKYEKIRPFFWLGKPSWNLKVTLDPETAHSNLNVSADQKILRQALGESKLYYPQRFKEALCVLGCERFASGRHYWEVKVGEEASWAVGVARESVDRKEELKLNSKEGIWVVRKEPKYYRTEPARLSAGGLTLNSDTPETVGVFLDYRLKRVMFFDAIQGMALYTFHSCSFTYEKIRPFFWLGKPSSKCKAKEECYIQLSA